MKTIILFISLMAILFLSGCATKDIATKGSEFPKMYEEQPRSLLILPPMNESTDAEAKDYYMTTVEVPLAQMGYYIFPVEIVSDIMKQEGAYNTEVLYNMPLDRFAEYFGADAVLFTKIKKWDLMYAVLAANLTVSIEAEIRSTSTSEQLWHYTGTVVVDLSGSSDSGGGLAGLIVKAVATAINSAAADYVRYARVANTRLMYALPVGPYHGRYMQDQNDQVMRQK